MSTRYFALIWLALPAIVGCSRSTTVSGKVTFQNRAVTYGSVIFLNADNTARSGAIEPDGSFLVEGVHPGDVKIGVISRDPSKGRGGKKRLDVGKQKEKWFPLPKQYEDPATSGLGCTLAPGRVHHDVELK